MHNFKADTTYKAVPVDFQMVESKKGSPQIWIDYSVTTLEGEVKKRHWMNFGDKVLYTDKKTGEPVTQSDILAKTMVLSGYVGGDEGLKSPFVSVFSPRQVELTFEEHTFNGETEMRIKYVNPPYQPKPMKPYSGQAPKMGAAFAKAKAQLGIKTNPLEEI